MSAEGVCFSFASSLLLIPYLISFPSAHLSCLSVWCLLVGVLAKGQLWQRGRAVLLLVAAPLGWAGSSCQGRQVSGVGWLLHPCALWSHLVYCEVSSAAHGRGYQDTAVCIRIWVGLAGISRAAVETQAAKWLCLCVTLRKPSHHHYLSKTSQLLSWLHDETLSMRLLICRLPGWKSLNISVSAAHLFKHSIIYEDFPLKINDLWPEGKQ